MYKPREHECLITVDPMGIGVMHDTLDDAVQWTKEHQGSHIYWAERTPLTPSMMAYLCLT